MSNGRRGRERWSMKPERRPTLADVAREVGVSAKTVSRVLNGTGAAAPDTRRRVLQAVEELGFQLNPMARSMRTGNPDTTIGLVIPDLGNPFFGAVAGGIEDAVRSRGLTLLMGSSNDDPEREIALIQAFLARRVSALIVVPSVGADHSFLTVQQAAHLPLVFLDRPASGLTADAVVSSNRAGTHRGVAHLIEAGHRRIAFVGDSPGHLYTRRERLAGYRSALAEAGIAADPALIESAHEPATAARAVARLLALPDPPTALLSGNNTMTHGVVAEVARTGRKDIAVVAFDDVPMAEILQPPLTVIAQAPVAMGDLAGSLILRRLDGDRPQPRTHVVDTDLIVRGSGEIPVI